MATRSIESTKTSRSLSSFIPILAWLPRYNRGWLMADILAGLKLWGLVVPEDTAYAGVAGLPPQFGLRTPPYSKMTRLRQRKLRLSSRSKS